MINCIIYDLCFLTFYLSRMHVVSLFIYRLWLLFLSLSTYRSYCGHIHVLPRAKQNCIHQNGCLWFTLSALLGWESFVFNQVVLSYNSELLRPVLKPLVGVWAFDAYIKSFNTFVISSTAWICKSLQGLGIYWRWKLAGTVSNKLI